MSFSILSTGIAKFPNSDELQPNTQYWNHQISKYVIFTNHERELRTMMALESSSEMNRQRLASDSGSPDARSNDDHDLALIVGGGTHDKKSEVQTTTTRAQPFMRAGARVVTRF